MIGQAWEYSADLQDELAIRAQDVISLKDASGQKKGIINRMKIDP